MNKYLLLRDNKQSGPYLVTELAAHGIKPYDLVWLEGKSAAWRYPSEIEELKPFAPVVEEQPFDRFYKKSEIKTSDSAISDNTLVESKYSVAQGEIKKSEPVISLKSYPEFQANGSKKIHVSLPGTKRIDAIPIKAIKEELVIDSYPLEKPKSVSQFPNSNEADSLNFHKKIHPSASKSEAGKSDDKETYKKPHTNDHSKKEVPVSKLLFRSVAAACLLLGGALIGLVINYNSQQKKFQQLNQLVQEIRHQDNPGSPKAAMKNDFLSGETNESNFETESSSPTSAEQPVYKEDIQLPLAKKDRRDAKSVRGSSDTASHAQPGAEEVVPAVSEKEEPIQKMDRLASEVARKNLWQLVSVDHNTYKTGVFGGISNLSLKISNKSLFQLEQVEVEILYFSPENKTVNKQKVVFENVSPGEQLTIAIPKSGRGVKIDYSIKKINTKEFGLAHAGM